MLGVHDSIGRNEPSALRLPQGSKTLLHREVLCLSGSSSMGRAYLCTTCAHTFLVVFRYLSTLNRCTRPSLQRPDYAAQLALRP